MASYSGNSKGNRRHVMAAVVLGTALSTIGVPAVQARQSTDAEPKAVHDISRYCTTCWKNARLPADCWSDCTQEVFSRLIQTLPQSSWNRVFKAEGEERQEFVRAIDAVKKRTQRRLKRDRFLNDDVVPDHRSRHERQRTEEREVVRQAASEVLSERQQRILQMSMEGWAVQDIAEELGIGADRVSDEKYKAVRKLRRHLEVE